MMARELLHEELEYACAFDIGKMLDNENDTLFIGQERAKRSIQFGMRVKSNGYNIYAAGIAGSGKVSMSKKCAEEFAKEMPIPDDWCYICDFENPKIPIAVNLKAGQGKEFRDDISELIDTIAVEIPKAFSEQSYEKHKSSLLKKYQDQKECLMKEVAEKAKAHEFGVKHTNSGIYFLPIVDGETITEEQFDKLSEEEKDKINSMSEVIQEKAEEVIRSIKDIDKLSQKDIEDLEYKTGIFVISHRISALKEKYNQYDLIIKYLTALEDDLLDNIQYFVEEDTDSEDSLQSLLPWLPKKNNDDITSRYCVNLIVDNNGLDSAPVVVDYNPTYYNLLGEIEYDNEFGNLITDYMNIKAGSLHKANGGFLILPVDGLLMNIHAWESLMLALKTGVIKTEGLKEALGGITVSSIKPEPIPLNIKIILTGSYYLYEVLSEYDESFSKYFKILADFDVEMKYNMENVSKVVSFIKAAERQENMSRFSAEAVKRLLKESSRIAERNDRLTTRFSEIKDLIVESNFFAQEAGSQAVDVWHVEKALSEKQMRNNMYEEKLGELIEDNIIMISTSGSSVGKINGLAVIETGNHIFAKPTCITANVYAGKAGIVNIEKESDMSGSIHDKGVQVISGYLGQMFAQDFPLSLSCRICFEQNYSGIDGDSASSTELYAILSALADVPIKQYIAVTGSVNQKGEIQPIGGVTYKIEGFFDLCKSRGLNGNEGVIIPYQNIPDLVLKDEVVLAVKENLFHIYPVSTIEEGIEILTGVSAGNLHSSGKKSVTTIFGKVYKRLKDYYTIQTTTK